MKVYLVKRIENCIPCLLAIYVSHKEAELCAKSKGSLTCPANPNDIWFKVEEWPLLGSPLVALAEQAE